MEMATQTGQTLPAGPDYWPVPLGYPYPAEATEEPHQEPETQKR